LPSFGSFSQENGEPRQETIDSLLIPAHA